MSFNLIPYQQRLRRQLRLSSAALRAASSFEVRASKATITISFGCIGRGEDSVVTSTVAAPWVTGISHVICTASALPTADHDAEDAAVEGLVHRAIDVVPGVGFTMMSFAPNGTWGQYLVDIRS